MKSWITAQPSEEEDGEECRLDLVSCLVEAARQLRWEFGGLFRDLVGNVFSVKINTDLYSNY